MSRLTPPPLAVVDDLIRRALAEDFGAGGDITSEAVVPPDAVARATVVARQDGTIAGLTIGARVFTTVDPAVSVELHRVDGDTVAAGTELATVQGPAVSVLSAERTALNLLGHLSGIATATRRMVDAVAGTGAKVVDTRKTTPGLRALEKYAVRAGGGANHRFGLYDAVLIKDNHLAVGGGVAEAVAAARSSVGHTVRVEVEVETLEQVAEAVEAGADIILLDNMHPSRLRDAVGIVNGRALTEASGRVDLAAVRSVAEAGVDLISSGALTHSAPRLDVALDFAPEGGSQAGG